MNITNAKNHHPHSKRFFLQHEILKHQNIKGYTRASRSVFICFATSIFLVASINGAADTVTQPLRTFTFDGSPINVIFSPDGTKALVRIQKIIEGPNATITLKNVLIDTINGEIIYDLGSNWFTAFSTNGEMIAGEPSPTNGSSGFLVMDIMSGAVICNVPQYLVIGRVCIFSQDDTRILTNSNENTITLYDIATTETIRSFSNENNPIRHFDWSVDNKHIVSCSGGYSSTAILWGSQNTQQVRSFEGHAEGIYLVKFSSDGKKILTADSGGFIKVWDITADAALLTFSGHGGDNIGALEFAPDGRQAMSLGRKSALVEGQLYLGGDIKIWDTNTGTELRIITCKSDDGSAVNAGFTSADMSSDGTKILTADSNKVSLWDSGFHVQETIGVPNVVGLEKNDAIQSINNANLSMGSTTEEYSDSVLSCVVLAQEPLAGTQVYEGEKVSLVVSKGSLTLAAESVKELLISQFESADTNKDGMLSFEEASAACPSIDREIFELLDSNSDGFISKDELESFTADEGCGCRKSGIYAVGGGLRISDLFISGLTLCTLVLLRRHSRL